MHTVMVYIALDEQSIQVLKDSQVIEHWIGVRQCVIV